MRKIGIAVCLAIVAVICSAPLQAQEDVQSQIQQIKQQLGEMDALKTKLAELEKKLDESKKAQESNAPTVTAGSAGVKAKIDGRIFIGTTGSGNQGSTPNWSTDIPDAKLRFTLNPSKNITIVNRLSTSGAKSADFDYFYLDYAGLLGPGNVLRLGQRKIDVGQETWVDNPIENMLITNSVSHVSGYGIGTALLGRLGASKLAPVYEVGFVNGPKGVTVRPSDGLPINIKIGKALPGNMFGSVSYFNTGTLQGADKSPISIAEISDAPVGASTWKRALFEVDLRYNYGPTGIRPMLPSANLPRVMLEATYGVFNDSATGAPGRDGSYWFTEGLYNITNRLYAAGRYSVVSLNDGALARLAKSPVAVNEYTRTSIGLGYRLTDLTDVKAEYTINNTSGGASSPDLNQWSIGVASKF